MLRYCPNGYKLWDLEENKLTTKRDVVFDKKKTRKTFIRNKEFYFDSDNKNDNEEKQAKEEAKKLKKKN